MKFGMYVQQDGMHRGRRTAKVLPFRRATKIIKRLWTTNPTKRSRTQRMKTALMLALAVYTGARFGKSFFFGKHYLKLILTKHIHYRGSGTR